MFDLMYTIAKWIVIAVGAVIMIWSISDGKSPLEFFKRPHGICDDCVHLRCKFRESEFLGIYHCSKHGTFNESPEICRDFEKGTDAE